jgi:hypothetical protein
MSSWRSFSLTFAVVVPILLAGVAVGGHALPEPYGSFVPLGISNIMRSEAVWTRPSEPPSCVVLLGDSRVAFHINTAALSRPDCHWANLAYPALGGRTLVSVAREAAAKGPAPRLIVLGITEGIFQIDVRTQNSGETIQSIPLVRRALLGQQRAVRAFEGLFGVEPVDNGWSWDGKLGRWVYHSLTSRTWARLPSRAAEATAMARTYFVADSLPRDLDVRVGDLLDAMLAVGVPLAVLLPPASLDFVEEADRIAPGEVNRFRESVRANALHRGVRVIDCANPAACGLSEDDFADPLHLNAKGAEVLTATLGAAIAPVAEAKIHP